MSALSAICGVGFSTFGKRVGKSAMTLTLEACAAAIRDSGLARDEVDGCLVTMPAVMGEQHGWATRVAAHLGLEPRLAATIDMGGASPVGMIQTAALYVNAGLARAVLCAFGMQNSPQGVIIAMIGSQFAAPYGDVGAITFAAHVARRQMHEQGVTSMHYAHVATAFREHATRNPLAQMKTPMSVDDHQASRLVVEPLRLFDCCLVTDGGGAVIVTSLERARDLRHAPAVIAGFGQEHGAELIVPKGASSSSQASLGARAARTAFEMAGARPSDVDGAFLYDSFTPLVLHELEAFGFCERGEAGAFVESGALRLGGRLPTNTHGGLLSEGHLFGMGHVAEAVRQIRGECGARQLPRTELLFVNGYGGAPHEAPPTASYATLLLRPDSTSRKER
jgi:acetyl-CoA acetyltransferase